MAQRHINYDVQMIDFITCIPINKLGKTKFVGKKMTTRAGFEPARAMPKGTCILRLNHSAIVSLQLPGGKHEWLWQLMYADD